MIYISEYIINSLKRYSDDIKHSIINVDDIPHLFIKMENVSGFAINLNSAYESIIDHGNDIDEYVDSFYYLFSQSEEHIKIVALKIMINLIYQTIEELDLDTTFEQLFIDTESEETSSFFTLMINGKRVKINVQEAYDLLMIHKIDPKDFIFDLLEDSDEDDEDDLI